MATHFWLFWWCWWFWCVDITPPQTTPPPVVLLKSGLQTCILSIGSSSSAERRAFLWPDTTKLGVWRPPEGRPRKVHQTPVNEAFGATWVSKRPPECSLEKVGLQLCRTNGVLWPKHSKTRGLGPLEPFYSRTVTKSRPPWISPQNTLMCVPLWTRTLSQWLIWSLGLVKFGSANPKWIPLQCLFRKQNASNWIFKVIYLKEVVWNTSEVGDLAVPRVMVLVRMRGVVAVVVAVVVVVVVQAFFWQHLLISGIFFNLFEA